jgi:hypothetical protein
MFATTILHELTHAFGVMMRGNLKEPYYDLDDPQAELGWSWEQFALSGIINSFDRTSARVSFLMWKIWLTDEEAYAKGGKEWTAVPIRWVSQWFQRSTWDAIEKFGHQAVEPPSCDLKLHCSGDGRYTVLSDSDEALRDVLALKSKALAAATRSAGPGTALTSVRTIKTNTRRSQTCTQEAVSKATLGTSSWTSRALAHAGLSLGTVPSLLQVAALKRPREESIGDADSDDEASSSHLRPKKRRL